MTSEETGADSKALWSDAPLASLIDHVIVTYHDPLRAELPRLHSLARTVHEDHGDDHREVLSEVLSIVTGLRFELEDHMAKEEQVLFPMIREGQGCMADGPITIMEQEHEAATAALRRLRDLTESHGLPVDASEEWRALWRGLQGLEASMRRHIELENEVLFPRALMS